MKKLIKFFILTVTVIISMDMFSISLDADGFEADKKSDTTTEKWQCKFCPDQPLWEYELGLDLFLPSKDIHHFGNYTGNDEKQLMLSGSVKNINPDGHYWISQLDKLGSDNHQFNSRYGMQGKYELELDVKKLSINKFDALSSSFVNPGSSTLRLDDNWNRGTSSSDFIAPSLFTDFSLGTEWEQLGIKFNYLSDSNFDYFFDYSRIEKNGIRESSANQYFQAVYIPLPVSSSIDNFTTRVSYLSKQWTGTLGVIISKFDNDYQTISFANPFISVTSGANATILSDEPDNKSISLSIGGRYNFESRSFVKAYYSYTLLTQDQPFLPYTTNESLLNPLPKSSLDGEVTTQNMTLKFNHRFDSKWSVRAKYHYRDRYNKTDLEVYRPVISDVFSGSSIINIPYDFTQNTANLDLDWKLFDKHLMSIGLKNKHMERIFQTVRKTSEKTVFGKYRAYINNEFQFHLKVERSNRSGSEAELIDLISVTENPLLQRFNVSDREHNRLNMHVNYSPLDRPFSAIFTVQYSEDDYDETELGLQYSWQSNTNLDLSWQVNELFNIGLFIENETREANLGGSGGFSGRDWLVDNDDEVISTGLVFSVNELLDQKLTISGSFQYSIADTVIAINNAGNNSRLPVVESLWTQMELKADYQYSERLTFALTLASQDFESHDFAIDDVVPGTAANLLTFSAMSNNYNLAYLQLSARFVF